MEGKPKEEYTEAEKVFVAGLLAQRDVAEAELDQEFERKGIFRKPTDVEISARVDENGGILRALLDSNKDGISDTVLAEELGDDQHLGEHHLTPQTVMQMEQYVQKKHQQQQQH